MEVGRPGRLSSAFNEGRTAGRRPWPKTLGDLNNCSDDPNGGGGCLGHLPPSIVMHALCMHTAKQQKRAKRATPPKRTATDQTKKNQRKTPKPEREAEGVGCESGT